MVHHYGHSTETTGGPGPPTTESVAAVLEPDAPAAAGDAAAGDAAASAQMTAAATALQEHSGCSQASAVATVSVLAAVAAIENPPPATPPASTSANDGWSIVTQAASSPATDANAIPLAAAALDMRAWPPLKPTDEQQQTAPQQQQEAPTQSPAAAAAIDHVVKDFPGLAAAASAAENGQPIEQLSQPLQQQLQQFSESHQLAADGTPPDGTPAPELPVQQQQQDTTVQQQQPQQQQQQQAGWASNLFPRTPPAAPTTEPSETIATPAEVTPAAAAPARVRWSEQTPSEQQAAPPATTISPCASTG